MREGEWSTRFCYTFLRTSATHSLSGNLTPAFLGGKLALSDAPTADPPYFDYGRVDAAIDYNVLDWDVGTFVNWSESWRVRPVVGLRAAGITQTFESAFQGAWLDAQLSKRMTEYIKNDFWGIGPRIGLENVWNAWRGERFEVRAVMNFYTAYLLGYWSVGDVSRLTAVQESHTTTFERTLPIADRDFGALTFQAFIGLTLQYQRWSATAGYEINDWLNQCQIFDDATGPHNNDLILQGLTVSFVRRF